MTPRAQEEQHLQPFWTKVTKNTDDQMPLMPPPSREWNNHHPKQKGLSLTGRLFISNGTREPVSLPEVEGTGRIGKAKGESCAKVWSWATERLKAPAQLKQRVPQGRRARPSLPAQACPRVPGFISRQAPPRPSHTVDVPSNVPGHLLTLEKLPRKSPLLPSCFKIYI